MRFSPQFLDELRARLPVSEVVGRRVKLRKAGREWKGLSPFNKEKTPSFFVNDQKAMWFDFSSGKNGNIFDFVMQTEGVSFPGSGRAAGRAGRRADAGDDARSAGARGATKDAARHRRAGGKILRGEFGVARRRARPRLSRRPRHYVGDAAEVPARLCVGRAIRAQGASRRRENFGRRHGRGRASRRRRRYPGAVRPLSRPGNVSDRRLAWTRHRFRRPRAREGRVGEVSQFAGDAALPQGRDALQHRRGAQGGARRRARHRGRRLYRRHRHGDGGLRGDRRAARHRADRRSARPDVAHGRRADPLLRRRRCRPARRLSRARSGAAAGQAGQEPEARRATGRTGPGRSGALRRARGGRRRARRGAAARRRALGARERGRPVHHAGASRGVRGAAWPR